MNLKITGINDLDAIKGKLLISIESSKGGVVFEETLEADWKSGVVNLFSKKLDTSQWSGSYEVKVKVVNKDDTLLTENFIEFEVFNPASLTPPEGKVALLDFEGNLKKQLKKLKIKTVDFNRLTSKNIPVLVSSNKATNDKEKKRFKSLKDFVKNGGTAVYLDRLIDSVKAESYATPFTARVHPSRGLWTCIPHIAKDHPLFKGLQTNGFLRNTYENIWPQKTLRDLKINGVSVQEKPIVTSVAFDWFSKGNKLGYKGPGPSWWGADLTLISMGKGKYLLSQFQILENLGKDPVADKMLINMIKFLEKKE